MRRLLLLLTVVALASACSALGTAPAATVDGVEITTTSLQDEIETIRDNTAYVDILEQTYGVPSQGSGGEGTFGAAFVANILQLRVWYQALENELESRDLMPIPDDILEQAGADMEEQFASLDASAFGKFPKDYQEQVVEQRALILYVERLFREEIGEDPEAFYDENPDAFVEICVSHVLVGLQGGRTPAEAQAEARALQERIESGEDFATVAAEESEDPGSAQQGGDLGCGSRSSLQFDPTFEAAAFALDEGEVSDPVATQFGSHLITVTDRAVPDFDDVEASIDSVMRATLDERINRYLVDTICKGDIAVNPRYGTWAQESCEGVAPTIPGVEPPEGPRRPAEEGLEFGL
jgi:foldase protein PrsA